MKASSIVFVNNELDARYLRMAVRRGAGEQRNIGNITEIHSTGLDCETCGGGSWFGRLRGYWYHMVYRKKEELF